MLERIDNFENFIFLVEGSWQLPVQLDLRTVEADLDLQTVEADPGLQMAGSGLQMVGFDLQIGLLVVLLQTVDLDLLEWPEVDLLWLAAVGCQTVQKTGQTDFPAGLEIYQ